MIYYPIIFSHVEWLVIKFLKDKQSPVWRTKDVINPLKLQKLSIYCKKRLSIIRKYDTEQ